MLFVFGSGVGLLQIGYLGLEGVASALERGQRAIAQAQLARECLQLGVQLGPLGSQLALELFYLAGGLLLLRGTLLLGLQQVGLECVRALLVQVFLAFDLRDDLLTFFLEAGHFAFEPAHFVLVFFFVVVQSRLVLFLHLSVPLSAPVPLEVVPLL